MKYTVLGKKAVSFTSSDGKEIRGTTLYAGYETDGVEGMVADKLFVSTEKLPKKDIIVGTDIEVYFNRYGKVDSIAVG